MGEVVNLKNNELQKKEFLEGRLGKLGGSDIITIMGWNKFKTAFQLWQEKTGAVSIDYNESERARWGNLLENTISQEFAERNEVKLIHYKKPFVDKENDRMIANIDRGIVDRKDGRGPGLLEIKTVDAWVYNTESWEDGLPNSYWFQVQWYFMITGYKWGKFAILVGGNNYVEIEIAPDYELIKKLREVAENWIQVHLIEGKAPDKKAMDWKAVVPDPDSIKETTYEVFEKGVRLAEIKAQIKSLDKDKKAIETELQEEMEEAEILSFGDKRIATWKSSTRKTFQKAKFQVAYEDLCNKFTEEVPSRSFLLKLK